jgi:hypothetical protein
MAWVDRRRAGGVREAGTAMSLQPPPFRPGSVPESVGYALKRILLGKPLITSQLKDEKLGNVVALGVLSPDAISSSAYGTEEILLQLLPYVGLAAFTLVLPITGVILLILVLVAASYRQVLMAYTSRAARTSSRGTTSGRVSRRSPRPPCSSTTW